MPESWQPIATLRPGHYGTGRAADGTEHPVYNNGRAIMNAATGEAVSVTHWRR